MATDAVQVETLSPNSSTATFGRQPAALEQQSASSGQQIPIVLSVIVPAYNEQDNIAPLFDALTQTFSVIEEPYEVIFVDDGSSDSTFAQMSAITQRKDLPCYVQAVSFSRNFGKEAALYAGFERAHGDVQSFIDADLQQRPEVLLEMYNLLLANDDYDCVAAYQDQRTQGALRNWLSSKFYHLLSKSSDGNVLVDASDFRVFRRAVANALLSMEERFRFSKGLFSWIGFKTMPFPYTPEQRNAGTTSWSFMKLVRYAIDGLVSFNTAPLKFATYLGSVTAFVALVYLLVVVIKRLALGVDVPGYATIVALILFIGGVQLIVLGIIGTYLARTYIEGKRRPVYLARRELSAAPTIASADARAASPDSAPVSEPAVASHGATCAASSSDAQRADK